MKRRIAVILTFAAGMLPILAFFTPNETMDWTSSRLESWMVIVAGFALTLGVVNVVQTHSRKIARGEAGWIYSLALLVPLVIMGGAGVLGAFGIPQGGIGRSPDGS